MKVIKVNKKFRNGNVIIPILLLEEMSNEDMIDLIEEYCDNDSNGSNYGYHYEWSFVEDETEFKDIVNNEIKKLNSRIEGLINYKNNIIKQLKTK